MMRTRSRPVVIALLAGTVAICTLLSGCSDFLEYTIVNETDRELTAWGFREPCETVTGYRNDYSEVLVIPPHDTAKYSETWGNGSDTDCIQVVDESRQLVLAEQYELGSTYVVHSIDQSAVGIPPFDDLPEQPWLDARWEEAQERPLDFAYFGATVLFGVIVVIALPYGIYRAVRDLRSQRRQGPA